MAFNYDPLFRTDLGPPAGRWTGYPKFNFVGGHNDPDSMPAADLANAAQRVIAREGPRLATYNMDTGPLGYRPLRDFVAATLGRVAGLSCGADDILITSGSLQAIDLVNAVMLQPGDTVVVEASTYGGALRRLRVAGVDWLGVDLDEDGLRPDSLDEALTALAARGTRPKYIYTIPTVQNPTGTVMSEARRMAILEVADKHDVPILEDDCYADLIWNGTRPRALHALDRSGRVIYCGSFSKSLAPSLRLGYLVADWAVLSRAINAKSDGGTGAIDQMVLAEYAVTHFDNHVARLRQALKAKCGAMVAALETHFGVAAEFRIPDGGIFIWVRLPDSVDTTRLAAAALAEGIAVNPGADWTADPATGRHAIRLCFGYPTPAVIAEGVARLADVCHRETGLPAQSANIPRT